MKMSTQSTNFNSLNTIKMIKIESVLQDVYRLIDQNAGVTEDDILESAASAMSHLYNYKLYERALCILPVNNHQALLPDYYEILHAYYKPCVDSCDLSNLDDIINTVQIDISGITSPHTSLTGNITSVTDENGAIVGKLGQKTLFDVRKSATSGGWSNMALSHNIINQLAILRTDTAVVQAEDPTGAATYCDYTYSVHGSIVTCSARQGFILLAYVRTPRDQDGDLIIPALPLVNEAIKSYILMEMHERSMNMHEQGAIGLYDRYFNKWERLSAAAMGELMKPSWPEWVAIVKDNRYFTDDAPERIYEGSSMNESTNIGYTNRSYYGGRGY